jgi:hypothetical protein
MAAVAFHTQSAGSIVTRMVLILVAALGRLQKMDRRNGCSRREVLSHSCNMRIGLLQNLLHIFEFDVVCWPGIFGRDGFCCTTKIDGEGGKIKMLCLDNFFDEVNNYTSRFDQQTTKNCVHGHLGPCHDDKGGCAPSFVR